MTDTFSLHRGTRPLLVSLPHVGTHIPDHLKPQFVDAALAVPDTDWHLDQLYAFVRQRGASLLVPRMSRYVIDLNRPDDDQPMYAASNNTGLCPTTDFAGKTIYRDGMLPDADQIARRRDAYWRPYHDALRLELQRLVDTHGYAVLFDGHSIRSELPWLFEGRLPDLNLGTASGTSCAASLRQELGEVLASQSRFTHVVDGRFKGGHITRAYGRPQQGIHAVQLEMCWSCYMEEAAPFVVDARRAASLQRVLEALVESMLEWKPHDG